MTPSVRAAKPAEVCLWNFWWNLIWTSNWSLKSPMGKIWRNLGGGLFYLTGKHEQFRGEFRSKFRRKFRKLRFKFRDVFGNFVQQKGGANLLALLGQVPGPLRSIARCGGYRVDRIATSSDLGPTSTLPDTARVCRPNIFTHNSFKTKSLEVPRGSRALVYRV